jgi:Predicted dinucleotide-binding enzymes
VGLRNRFQPRWLGTETVSNRAWAGLGSLSFLESKDLRFPVTTHGEAIADADVVVNATPGSASLEVFETIGDQALTGKVLIDLANPTTPEFELIYPNSSLAEKLQDALPGARVVKTANTAYIGVIADPSTLGEKGNLLLSGDDEEAKQVTRELLVDLGWEGNSVTDLGGIETARNVEPYFLLFFNLVQATGGPQFNIAVVS